MNTNNFQILEYKDIIGAGQEYLQYYINIPHNYYLYLSVIVIK